MGAMLQGGPRPRPDAAEIDAALAEVFADPELSRRLDATGMSLVEAWAWIVERFMALVRSIDDLRFENPLAYWLIFAALLAVLGALLWHIGYTLKRALSPTPSAAERASDAARTDRARMSRELRQRARALAAQGRTREAVRHLILALLALVEERNVLHVARGWTHREILERLASRIDLGGDARRFEEIGNRACYGGATIAPEDFAAMDGFLDGLDLDARRR